MNLKKVTNLEKPKMKGIMSSNPFSVLQINELSDKASLVGVDIREDLADKHSDSSFILSSHASSS